jgi:pyruvate ferredoxin oxidoreductase gamma subunit
MNKTIEIRWHGRGGQGTKTAALLLADTAFHTGMYVQGFPEYGPERMGAPITAYNRLSNEVIRVHSNNYEPDAVVVVDETLLDLVDVTKGLKPEGPVLINSTADPAALRKKLRNHAGPLYIIDAKRISTEAIGRNIPNMPMLAAVVKVFSIMKEDDFIGYMRESFSHKFSTKPEVVEGNIQALRKTLEEVNAR